MKKKYIILTSIILTIMIIILILSDLHSKNKQIKYLKSNYSFYKEDLKDRYDNYQKKFNLSDKETIIKVNIGLDDDFYTNVKEATNLNKTTILVNKYNYLTNTYKPNNLVSLDQYAKSGLYLVSEAYEAFKRMASEAEINHLKIRIVSAYRSYDYQNNLYNKYLKFDTQEKVDTYSARPGYSEHQTGLAIDIDNVTIGYEKFHYTQEFTWVKNNAYKYGFILRYDIGKEAITGYKYEPWHYRYVGTKISEYIYKNNLTYEEYYYEFID